MATSGMYERGRHIWRRQEAAAGPAGSVTVVGPGLGTADARATALFAAGDIGWDWLARFPAYGLVLIDHDGPSVTAPVPSRRGDLGSNDPCRKRLRGR